MFLLCIFFYLSGSSTKGGTRARAASARPAAARTSRGAAASWPGTAAAVGGRKRLKTAAPAGETAARQRSCQAAAIDPRSYPKHTLASRWRRRQQHQHHRHNNFRRERRRQRGCLSQRTPPIVSGTLSSPVYWKRPNPTRAGGLSHATTSHERVPCPLSGTEHSPPAHDRGGGGGDKRTGTGAAGDARGRGWDGCRGARRHAAVAGHANAGD